MSCHITEIHCKKKKRCKYCHKSMRSPSLKRHKKYSCLARKKILKSKKKAKEQAKHEEETKNEIKEQNKQNEQNEHERNEAFFKSFLTDFDNDPLVNGRKNESLQNESLKNELSMFLKFTK